MACGLADGRVAVVSLLKPSLDMVKELKAEGSNEGFPVTCVKFAPSGKVLAAVTDRGAEGASVVFYDCENTASPGGAFTLKAKLELSSLRDVCNRAAASCSDPSPDAPPASKLEGFTLSSPAALDFSEDSATFQLATSHGLVYASVAGAAVLGNTEAAKAAAAAQEAQAEATFTAAAALAAVSRAGATKTKDEKWASYSATLGWAARGAVPPLAGGTDASGIAARSGGGRLLATVDGCGALSLFKWPCPSGAGQDGHPSGLVTGAQV